MGMALSRPPGGALDAAATIRTIEADEDGPPASLHEPSGPVLSSARDGAGVPGGPPKAEPGTGAALTGVRLVELRGREPLTPCLQSSFGR